jgi:hypothetical protein
MSTPTRIYLIVDQTTETKQLIRASNQAQAVRHAAQNKFSVTVATQDDLVALLKTGAEVVDASKQEEDEHAGS